MIVIPSPQLLIYSGNKDYVTQISQREHKSGNIGLDTIAKDDCTLNLSLMCLNGSNPSICKSRIYSSVIVSDFLELKSPSNPLFFGLLSASVNDFQNAVYWLKIAAQRNCVTAMNALGLLYLKTFYSEKNDDSFSCSIRWFNRAYRLGSTQSLQYLAQAYQMSGRSVEALSLFSKHYQKSKSLQTMICIANLFKFFDCIKSSTVWNMACIGQGDLTAVKNLIALQFYDDNDEEETPFLSPDIPIFESLLNTYSLEKLEKLAKQNRIEDQTNNNNDNNITNLDVLPQNSNNVQNSIPDDNTTTTNHPLSSPLDANVSQNDPLKNLQTHNVNSQETLDSPINNLHTENNITNNNMNSNNNNNNNNKSAISTNERNKLGNQTKLKKEKLKSMHFKEAKDLSLPSFKYASNIFWLIEPLANNTKNVLQHQKSLEFGNLAWRMNPKELENEDVVNYLQSTTTVQPPFFPSASKSSLLKLVFKYASPNFAKRNLLLSFLFLQKIRFLHPKGISESVLFRNRCKSGTPKQLVQCGFISIMSFDSKFALQLFQRAANHGNITGSLMAGLMMFHGLNVQHQTQSGCFFLGQCPSDPIALLHLGLACKDEIWEKRALELLGMSSRSKMYEWMGDLFSSGVKLPVNIGVALVFYGMAMEVAEEDGEDLQDILMKMSEVSREPTLSK
ncbi:hypothetical protein TRFO_31100 [Tritrichomonas foetus]|uniref:Uncharacterized protein n=1 Tax=Tritrichomonas foetus TaxID=1144522 RepID=A0A1J4JS79_9EUKA|nr:hypothetical protein TRFO_31100 [Tritrichomonas foetus]|eukprot:OHT01961.1 hypothetical protein TRFO_31100 [Tritrichomonas foetus]